MHGWIETWKGFGAGLQEGGKQLLFFDSSGEVAKRSVKVSFYTASHGTLALVDRAAPFQVIEPCFQIRIESRKADFLVTRAFLDGILPSAVPRDAW